MFVGKTRRILHLNKNSAIEKQPPTPISKQINSEIQGKVIKVFAKK